MADVEFKDYTINVQRVMTSRILAALEEAAGEMEAQVKRNTRVDTGKTKNSFRHKTAGDLASGEYMAYIGSDYENAIWEEFGTGEYALGGDGRKGGWFYEDAEGNGHFTHGKKPSRAFWKAYTKLKSKIIKYLQNSLKGM